MSEADEKSMTQQVWKYQIKEMGINEISIPAGAVIIDFECQSQVWTMWALVTLKAPPIKRIFLLMYTGFSIDVHPNTLLPIGTAMTQKHALVAHLFEVQSVVGYPAKRFLK